MFLYYYLAQSKNCPDIKKIRKGNVKGSGVSPGSKRTFSCINKNWVINGRQEITCLKSGQWSNPQPTCMPAGERMFSYFHNAVNPLRSKLKDACP